MRTATPISTCSRMSDCALSAISVSILTSRPVTFWSRPVTLSSRPVTFSLRKPKSLLRKSTPSLIVPADAVVFNTDGQQVVVVEDGVAHYHKITVARDLGTQVEVSDGVRTGDQVILRPMVQLVDGSKVRVDQKPAEISQK